MPAYRAELDDDEKVSLRHLEHYLGDVDRYLVAPQTLRLDLPGFRRVDFPDRCLASRRGYSALLLSRAFYRSFDSYEFVLVYQLDSLVFSGDLASWCLRGYDYIAPVHTIGDHPPTVGNGGFSLRRIPAFLAVLESRTRTVDPERHWSEHWAGKPPLARLQATPRRYAKRLRLFNGVGHEIRGRNRSYAEWAEDWFWTLRAEAYSPTFRRAPPEVGLEFAFNEQPREAFAANGGRLPFGCHGWSRFDRGFWEPYLLPAR